MVKFRFVTDWANEQVNRLRWHHIGFIKLSVAAFTLLLAKLAPDILCLDWYWYAVACALFAIPVYVRLFNQ